ncbi:hypothetical protein ABZY57_10485 [Streptomyces sp. NPDC006450]|uniref:hypothetical protein n=1 Tax=Streptomyces sp. NPDC006450 TaxID=3155458 RepID=UPI0033B26C2E
MKILTRAAATASLLFVTALGLSLPTAGAAVAGNCAGCIDDVSVTAELGPAWSGRSAQAGGCGNCWSYAVAAPAGWNGSHGDA